jgi:predicted acylesterase/phospholipase RssA
MHNHEFRARRVGLVFSGGGAKGAYHIGCWKALRASGVEHFHALAGSSVGAINAVFAATGRLEIAEETWRNLRSRDVIGFSLKSALRLPAWLIAAVGSEFSPFKITRLSDRVGDARTRWIHGVVCAALAAGFWIMRGILPASVAPWAPLLAVIPLVLAALTHAHRFTRPVFLRPVFTSSAPLARTLERVLSNAVVLELRDAGRPVYGVLSQHTPEAAGAHQWGGWSPSYVRLDRAADAETLRRTLVDGSAVPGFLCAGRVEGRPVLDGAWTDNVPAAPLLFGDDQHLDVLIVVYLKRSPRHTPRHNSLSALLQLLARDGVAPLRPHADILTWARTRWDTSRAAAVSSRATEATAPPGSPRRPIIVSVAPSRRVGNFFTGTLWFSRTKSASLIDLGERDMQEALTRLSGRLASMEATRSPRRSRGKPAAAARPAPALLRPHRVPTVWPSPRPRAAGSRRRT